jgi:hypothetical protein
VCTAAQNDREDALVLILILILIKFDPSYGCPFILRAHDDELGVPQLLDQLKSQSIPRIEHIGSGHRCIP